MVLRLYSAVILCLGVILVNAGVAARLQADLDGWSAVAIGLAAGQLGMLALLRTASGARQLGMLLLALASASWWSRTLGETTGRTHQWLLLWSLWIGVVSGSTWIWRRTRLTKSTGGVWPTRCSLAGLGLAVSCLAVYLARFRDVDLPWCNASGLVVYGTALASTVLVARWSARSWPDVIRLGCWLATWQVAAEAMHRAEQAQSHAYFSIVLLTATMTVWFGHVYLELLTSSSADARATPNRGSLQTAGDGS